MYIHELPEWPNFTWDGNRLLTPLSKVRHSQGRLLGNMQGLGFALQAEAVLETLTQDVVKSSEIEGEKLNPEQVRSSIARRLGMDIGALTYADRNVEGIVEVMLDATGKYADPLTDERLFAWHGAMFPGGVSGMHKIRVAAWRDDAEGPMQVVSGPIGREKVHYEAPAAERLPAEMGRFLDWFNGEQSIDPVLKAALAHLWFVTVHPFDDGNGRIGRAIADMALTQSDNSAQRFYSMSAQIQRERAKYYDMLEKVQKDSMDVTPWMEWFLDCLFRSIENAEETLSSILIKAKFWEKANQQSLNERQRKVLNRLLDGFEGKLTSSKWAALAKTTQITAIRDIQELVEKGLLTKDPAGGRSTSYSLKI